MNNEDKLINLITAVHTEVMYNISLMAGFFPKPFVDEHIVPQMEQFYQIYNDILADKSGYDICKEVRMTS